MTPQSITFDLTFTHPTDVDTPLLIDDMTTPPQLTVVVNNTDTRVFDIDYEFDIVETNTGEFDEEDNPIVTAEHFYNVIETEHANIHIIKNILSSLMDELLHTQIEDAVLDRVPVNPEEAEAAMADVVTIDEEAPAE